MERLENGVLVFKLIRVIEDQICAKHHSDTNMMIDGTPIMINDNGRKLDGSQSVTKVCVCYIKIKIKISPHTSPYDSINNFQFVFVLNYPLL